MEPEPITLTSASHTHSTAMPITDASNSRGRKRGNGRDGPPRQTVFRIGRSIIRPSSPTAQTQPGTGNEEEPERPVTLITHEADQGAAATRIQAE